MNCDVRGVQEYKILLFLYTEFFVMFHKIITRSYLLIINCYQYFIPFHDIKKILYIYIK